MADKNEKQRFQMRKMQRKIEEINENLLTGVNRQIRLARLGGLLSRKHTGAYCALACPSGYFGIEYGIDTGGPSVRGIFDPLAGGLLRVFG